VEKRAYIQALEKPDEDSWDFASVRSLRGRLSWLANATRPDIRSVVAELAQVTESTPPEELSVHLKMASSTVPFFRSTCDVRLVFPVLKTTSAWFFIRTHHSGPTLTTPVSSVA
jgi:hypothetical protein